MNQSLWVPVWFDKSAGRCVCACGCGLQDVQANQLIILSTSWSAVPMSRTSKSWHRVRGRVKSAESNPALKLRRSTLTAAPMALTTIQAGFCFVGCPSLRESHFSLLKELLLASSVWRYNQVITALWTLGCQAIASEEPLYMLALRLDVQSTSLSALNPRFLGPYILLRPGPVDALLSSCVREHMFLWQSEARRKPCCLRVWKSKSKPS